MKRDPISVACPTCGARAGEPCVTAAQLSLPESEVLEAIWQRAARDLVLRKLEEQLKAAGTAEEVRALAKEIEAVRRPGWRIGPEPTHASRNGNGAEPPRPTYLEASQGHLFSVEEE